MYHRYTSRAEGMQNVGTPRLRERIRNILLVVLAVACILLAIFGGRAMSSQAELRDTFIHRVQIECNDALNLTGSLSRTAGANSAATIGRIRSHVYAMEIISELNPDGDLISTEVFTMLYSVLDDYSNKLITGMQTGDLQTELTTSLTALANLVNQLD